MSEDPPSTEQDRFCAQLARSALFPLTVDWDGAHHKFFPALEALERLRKNLLDAEPNQALSKVYPKRVVVVKAIGSDQLQWNGQPDVQDDSSFQVIPDKLNVKCMQCPDDRLAYLRNQNEIVVCSNNVIHEPIPERLQQRDLPPKSLQAVEEALAHQISCYDGISEATTCEKLAALELRAAEFGECYYGSSKQQVRRGSGLPPGYSWLPFKGYLKSACVKKVAARETCREYENGASCVDAVLKNKK